MRIIRLLPGNMTYCKVLQIRNLSALKDLDHELKWESMIRQRCAMICTAAVSYTHLTLPTKA